MVERFVKEGSDEDSGEDSTDELLWEDSGIVSKDEELKREVV